MLSGDAVRAIIVHLDKRVLETENVLNDLAADGQARSDNPVFTDYLRILINQRMDRKVFESDYLVRESNYPEPPIESDCVGDGGEVPNVDNETIPEAGE